jgi:hypothetical protein
MDVGSPPWPRWSHMASSCTPFFRHSTSSKVVLRKGSLQSAQRSALFALWAALGISSVFISHPVCRAKRASGHTLCIPYYLSCSWRTRITPDRSPFCVLRMSNQRVCGGLMCVNLRPLHAQQLFRALVIIIPVLRQSLVRARCTCRTSEDAEY